MAGGEGIYCRSAIQPRARDPLPTAGAGDEHGTATRATTSPHGTRDPPLHLRTQEIEFTIFFACEPLVQAATPAATGDRLRLAY